MNELQSEYEDRIKEFEIYKGVRIKEIDCQRDLIFHNETRC